MDQGSSGEENAPADVGEIGALEFVQHAKVNAASRLREKLRSELVPRAALSTAGGNWREDASNWRVTTSPKPWFKRHMSVQVHGEGKMSRTKKFLLASVLAVSAAASANAATIELGSDRCNDGDPNCHMITIEGRIEEGDEVRFAKVAKDVTGGIVLMNSPGGEFKTGLDIARQIRAKKLNTGALYCASICAVMWLSGSDRYYTKKSSIGFHGVYRVLVNRNGERIKGFAPSVPSGANAVLGAYLNELGVPSKSIDLLVSPGSENMYWLKTKHLDALGIKATRLD
jgi:hypothetical protein